MTTTPTEPEFLAADALPARAHTGAAPALRLHWRRSLQMHPVLAAVTAALVFVTLVGYGLAVQPQYQAQAVFSVSPVVTTLLPQGGASTVDVTQFDSTMQQHVETLQRADTVEAAVRSLPVGAWRRPGESIADATTRMQRALSVGRVGTSLQLAATLSGPTAKDASQALSAISRQFLKTVHTDEDGRATERVQLLKEEAARLDSNLQADRDAAAQLAGQLGVSRLLDSERIPADLSADQLRQQLADLQRARAFARAGIPSTAERGGSDETANATTVTGLITTLNARKAALSSQMAGMTPRNPFYQQDAAELRSIDAELTSALDRGDAEQLRRQDRLRDRSVRGVTQEEHLLQQQLASQTGSMAGTAARLQRYSELSHEIDRLQTRLGLVRDAIGTTVLQSNAPSRVNMVVAPGDGSQPKAGKRRLAFLAALPLALLAGLLAAILAHRQDGRVFLAVDLEDILGIKPMAVLPVESEVSDALADQGVLRMAGSIESAYLKNGSKTFVFTATSPDSNVEELVFRLQGKLREIGYSALWIGAETLLRAEQDFEQMYGRGPSTASAMRFSDVPSTPEGTPEGIATQRLNWLKRDYDMVLVDAPPLLQSAMAEYAVRRTDATILVSESGVTTREELETASGLLDQLGTQGIGAVLQDLQTRYASQAYKKALQRAEEQAARSAHRDPVDNAGEWQVLHPGTAEELHIPGDPNVPRSLSRLRPRQTRTGWTEHSTPDAPHEPAPPNAHDWDESSARLVNEAAYTSHQE